MPVSRKICIDDDDLVMYEETYELAVLVVKLSNLILLL